MYVSSICQEITTLLGITQANPIYLIGSIAWVVIFKIWGIIYYSIILTIDLEQDKRHWEKFMIAS